MPTENSAAIRALVAWSRGKSCIFREKSLIFPARIVSAVTDDHGLSVVLDPIRAPGFNYPSRSELTVTVAWGRGSIDEESWVGGQGATWVLYFDDALFDSIHAVARSVADLQTIQRLEKLAETLDRRRR